MLYHQGQRNYECPKCSNKFYQMEHLKRHLTSIHKLNIPQIGRGNHLFASDFLKRVRINLFLLVFRKDWSLCALEFRYVEYASFSWEYSSMLQSDLEMCFHLSEMSVFYDQTLSSKRTCEMWTSPIGWYRTCVYFLFVYYR